MSELQRLVDSRRKTPSSHVPRKTTTRCLIATSIAVALAAAIVSRLPPPPRSPTDATGANKRPSVVLGPQTLSCGTVVLETHADANLPRLHVQINGGSLSDADVQKLLRLFSLVLGRRKPFTVAWDMRRFVWPRVSPAQYVSVRDWVGANVIMWDTYAQGHAIIVANPVAWAVINLALRVFQPPQPRAVVRRDDAGLAFARTCCLRPRSYVKRSYADRSERHTYFARMLAGSS